MSNYAKLNITRSCASSSAVIFIHNNLFNRWVEGREIPAQQTVAWTLEIGKVSNQMSCLNQRKILGRCPHTPPLMQHIFGPQWKLSGDVRLRVGGWAVPENLLLIWLFHGVFFVCVSWCRLLVWSSMPLDEDVFTDYSVGQEIGKNKCHDVDNCGSRPERDVTQDNFFGAETNMPFAPQCHFTILL